MKLRLLAASLAAFGLSAGIAMAQTAPPAAPPAAPAPVPANKPVLSYAIGYDLGKDLANQSVDVDVQQVIRGLQEGFAKKDPPAYSPDQMKAQLDSLQARMMAAARAEFERVAGENKRRSDAFMAANRSKPGVTTLPSGIQYRVIEPGNGAKPTDASTVQIHYRGSISTGQEFANTYAQANPTPASFKVGEFPIRGVREALKLMPVGARWEIFLPADQAFADDPRSPVGPGQALVFDIKLVTAQ